MSWLAPEPLQGVTIDAAVVRYRVLGPPGGDALLLLHGGGAHAGWWLGVAPELAGSHRLIVPELTGHGDSDHRPHYRPDLWARELADVIAAASTSPVHVVAHSMGGLAATYLAAAAPDRIRSVIFIDTPFGKLAPLPSGARRIRYFEDERTAVERFHLVPRETTAEPALLAKVARIGLRETPEGWRWKFDPNARQRFTNEGVEAELTKVRAPAAFIYGALSPLADEATADYVGQITGQSVPRLAIADAYHHVPLDAPRATSAAILRVLSTLGALA